MFWFTDIQYEICRLEKDLKLAKLQLASALAEKQGTVEVRERPRNVRV
jgi:hypothetical protein